MRKAEALKPEFERLKKKNVEIRIAANMDKDALKAAKDISKLAEVRELNNMDARFAIVDGKDLLFMLMNDK